MEPVHCSLLPHCSPAPRPHIKRILVSHILSTLSTSLPSALPSCPKTRTGPPPASTPLPHPPFVAPTLVWSPPISPNPRPPPWPTPHTSQGKKGVVVAPALLSSTTPPRHPPVYAPLLALQPTLVPRSKSIPAFPFLEGIRSTVSPPMGGTGAPFVASLPSNLSQEHVPCWAPILPESTLGQNRGTFLGVPILRTGVFWSVDWGPPIYGNFQLWVTRSPSKLANGSVRQALVKV